MQHKSQKNGCCSRSLGAFLAVYNELVGSEKFKPSKNESYRSEGVMHDINDHIETLSTFESVLHNTAMATLPLFYWYPYAEFGAFATMYVGHTIFSCTREELEKEKTFLQAELAKKGESEEQQMQ